MSRGFHNGVPAYRRKIIRGVEYGYVTLTDYATHHRKDYRCGLYGVSESRQQYARLVSEWESRGRQFPISTSANAVTIVEIVAAYKNYVQPTVSKTESGCIRDALAPLLELYAAWPADQFRPSCFKSVRKKMVGLCWSRGYVNRQADRIVELFRWAVEEEYISAGVHQTLSVIRRLRKGETSAPESRKVRPVAIEHVNAVKPHVSRQVWAMIQIQLLTAARVGEIIGLRPRDIERTDKVWSSNLDKHKTEHLGRERIIYFGPRAQDVLRPFLLRSDCDPMFSPIESEKERRDELSDARTTPLSCGNVVGSNVVRRCQRQPGPVYTAASYRRAIERACRRAGVPTWHPRRLRKTAATEIRREFNLESAQAVLGHSSAAITDAVYADRDMRQAVRVARKIG